MPDLPSRKRTLPLTQIRPLIRYKVPLSSVIFHLCPNASIHLEKGFSSLGPKSVLEKSALAPGLSPMKVNRCMNCCAMLEKEGSSAWAETQNRNRRETLSRA